MPILTGVGHLTNLPHFAALRHRDFRSTWLANMFSGGGERTFIVASTWLVLQKSDSSGWVGIVTFSSMLPFLVVSPIGGLMADRFDRRNLALVMYAASSINMAALAALALADSVQLWHVATLAFSGGVIMTVREPTIDALIPNQVPREDLLNAISLNATMRAFSAY